MAMTIEQRAAQLGVDMLGESWGPIVEIGPGVRLAPYYNGLILEVHGDTWTLAEATIADKFLATPA